MRESVKQQKEIALINAKTLQSSYEKERPEISYWFPSSYKHGNSYTLLLKIHNIGKGDCYNIEVKVKNKKSTRDLKKFLKVRDSIAISLILLDESTVEVFDETLGSLNKNTFMAKHVYIGKRLDLEIVFEFENIYGHRFEEVFEINFPLMENFDTMLRKYNFNSN